MHALDLQENAQKELLAQLRKERKELMDEFDDDSDLSKKILIKGIK